MWIIGTNHTITWTTDDFYYTDANDVPQPDDVKLEISHDNGSTWATIVADTPNTGSYSWLVTGPAAANCIVRYSGVHNTEITAQTTAFAIVDQVLTSITVAPLVAIIPPNTTRSFSATGYDQAGNPMVIPPTFTWSSTGGSINASTGLFTGGAIEGGPYTVTATSGSIHGTASATIKHLNRTLDARPFCSCCCGI
jgi:hypothetical protein